MIAAFSTSSPLSSVCLMQDTGEVLWSGQREAPGRASEACMSLLQAGVEATGLHLSNVSLFAADVGPGSFTGVRIGVVLAKTLAWSYGAMCVGADSFDLVDWDRTVVLPSRKGEFFVRVPGSTPFRTGELPADAVGYGFDGGHSRPLAENFAKRISSLVRISPIQLVPEYLIEPSISVSKKPLSRVTVD